MTTLQENYPFYLANEPKQSGRTIDLIDKFTGAAVAKIEIADALTIDSAIAAAVQSAPALQRWHLMKDKTSYSIV